MNLRRSPREITPAYAKLGNFDLPVDEIRIIPAIKKMTETFAGISENSPDPVRLDYYGYQIRKSEEQLDPIRKNTLI
jgi:hypothetical protein